MSAGEVISATQRLAPSPKAGSGMGPGRFPFGFGPRFYLAFLAGLLWLGPAWWDRRFLYGMLMWDVVVLLLWWWDLRTLAKPSEIELERAFLAPAALSSTSEVELKLRNRSAGEIWARVVDDAPASLIETPPLISYRVGASSQARMKYVVHPRSRGDVRLGEVFLRYTSAWQLAERWARVDLPQTVRVYANLEEARRQAVFLLRSRQVQLQKRLKRVRGTGREFESLREYHQGDEMRDICWTATARRRAPITKLYQVERSQAIWVGLDAGRLMRARVGALTKLDYAVNATLCLAQIALYSGDRFGLVAYGRQIKQRLRAAGGVGQLRAVMESLALVQSEASEANHVRAARELLAQQSQRSLVVWVTDLPESAATPDVIESATMLARRHLVLFLVIGNPELLAEAARIPQTEEDLYRCAAATEMVHRREVLIGQLRAQGLLAMELEAQRLSATLVNRYLEVKERGRI